MAKDAIVSDDLAKKFATEKDSPYMRWVRGEGLDIISAHYVPDLQHRRAEAVGTPRRPRRVHQPRSVADVERLLRLRDPAGKGAGAAAPAVRGDDLRARRARRDLGVERRRPAASPSSGGRARCSPFRSTPGTSISTAPARWRRGSCRRPTCRSIINLYDDAEFVFNTSHDFVGRFAGEPDYFATKGEQDGLLLKTNFVADAVNLPLISAKERGAGGGAHPLLDGEGLDEQPHLAVRRSATYKKGTGTARRARDHPDRRGLLADVARGRGAAPLRLAAGNADRAAEHVVPPALQHRHDARAIPGVQARGGSSVRNAQGVPKAWISQRIGGDQIDYADESPVVRETFAKALAENGLAPKMDEAYAAELADLPPKPGQPVPVA